MNSRFISRGAVVAATVLAAGCASVAVTDEAIETNTAQALGIPKGSFTISDRVNDASRSSYNVRTKSGKTYSCYVIGGVGITGRTVSDALCTETSKNAKGQPAPAPNRTTTNCNALLKAAGRCS